MSNNKSSSDFGFFGVLQLIFIVLKLCKLINWSWWVVLIPIWIELVLGIGLIAFALWINKK